MCSMEFGDILANYQYKQMIDNSINTFCSFQFFLYLLNEKTVFFLSY